MSAQVDVLAVLKKEADYSGCLGPKAAEARTKRLMQVHAAVAALIAERDALRKALSQKVNDAKQRAFEDWLESKSPSGDHEEVQWKWMTSCDYRDFIDEWRVQIDALITGESA